MLSFELQVGYLNSIGEEFECCDEYTLESTDNVHDILEAEINENLEVSVQNNRARLVAKFFDNEYVLAYFELRRTKLGNKHVYRWVTTKE